MPKSAISTFRLSRLIGGLNTVAEVNDLVAYPTPDNPQAMTEFSDIENFSFIERGGLRKAQGFSVYLNTGVNKPITGITRFLNSAGDNDFIYSQGTDVYSGFRFYRHSSQWGYC